MLERRDILSRMYDPGAWLQFPRCLLLIMDLESALLLSFLIGVANRSRAEENDGWFYCTMARISQELYFNSKQQTRIVAKLKDMGILITKREGMPVTRYFKVEYDRVYELVMEAQCCRPDSPPPGES